MPKYGIYYNNNIYLYHKKSYMWDASIMQKELAHNSTEILQLF